MSKATAPEVIRADAVYPLEQIQAFLGGRTSLREARRRERSPLRIRRVGRKSFVTGQDLLEFFQASPVLDEAGKPRQA